MGKASSQILYHSPASYPSELDVYQRMNVEGSQYSVLLYITGYYGDKVGQLQKLA